MSLTKLKKVTEENVHRFTLEGLEKKAKVVSIYDGDTCDLAFYRKGELVRFKCRLEDVDAPELREVNGKLVRDFLAHLCMGKKPDKFDDSKIRDKKYLQEKLDKNKCLVYAVFGKFDKYGRALVTLKIFSKGGKSINKMITDYKDKKSDSSSSSSPDTSDDSESSSQD
jgi:endonuclease YncB( thermonuclease family)